MIQAIFGRNTVISSLENKRVTKIYLKEGFNDSKILKLIKDNNLKPIFVSVSQLDKLSDGGNHQGVVAYTFAFKFTPLESLIAQCKAKDNALILILDEINDPHNFGAIIRSCDAFAVDGIIIKSRNQVQVTSTVYKVSTGAVDYVKISQVTNLNNAIKSLKEAGFWTYAAAGEAKDSYLNVNWTGKNALVLGNEGDGVSKLVRDNCDALIKIPMYGHVDSLNVSVACGILISYIKK